MLLLIGIILENDIVQSRINLIIFNIFERGKLMNNIKT